MQLQFSRKRAVLFSVGLSFLLFVFLSVGLGYYLVSPAAKGGPDRLFVVREGSTLKEVTFDLEKNEIIKGRVLFLYWARLMGYSSRIKAGEYRLNSGLPPLKLLNILSKGAILSHPVTVPEGFTVKQIATLLEKKGLVNKDKFLLLAESPDTGKRYGLNGPGLEGYLYPDTYQFSRGLSAISVIDTMIRRFKEVLAPFQKRIEQSDMTVEKVVTLASIVEKETGRGDERPVIASVFLNRLKRKMRLESDPTVIYGIKNFNGNLTLKNLARSTPYNTYVIRGLPPGPIANPGREAIKAVLYPADTAFLYFVSKNDGSHYFSKTLSEHTRAVDIYQKKRRSKPRKTS